MFYKLYNRSYRFMLEWYEHRATVDQITLCPIKGEGHPFKWIAINDLKVILPSHRLPDIMWTWLSEVVITDRLAEILEKSKLTGYDLRPVQVTKIKRGERDISKLPRLWELRQTGWAGMVPPKSGVKLRENCPGCGHLRYSHVKDASKVVDESQWDGSDFFMVWPLAKWVFVTERVREVFRHHNIKGQQFIPFPDVVYTKDDFSPGRLSFYMPDDRAKLLGEPLGVY